MVDGIASNRMVRLHPKSDVMNPKVNVAKIGF